MGSRILRKEYLIMLMCDGYKMCRGRLIVVPDEDDCERYYEEHGVCLYRPDTNCWYVQGPCVSWAVGYPAGDCLVVEESDAT